MTHRRRHDRPWPRRIALVMLVSTALLAGFAPASHASLLRRLDCAGIHYKGVTVAKIRERYHALLGHLRCGKLRSLARAYYDVAAPAYALSAGWPPRCA